MPQTAVGTKIEDAYEHLKTHLAKNGCRVTAENPPTNLTATQGSLWGMSPKTAKKTIRFDLLSDEPGTRITAVSALSSDYVGFTLVGCILSVAVMLMCAWIGIDLSSAVSAQNPTTWSWLVTSGGKVNAEGALLISGLAGVLTFFLIAVLVLETVIVAYIHRRVGNFAKEILRVFQ